MVRTTMTHVFGRLALFVALLLVTSATANLVFAQEAELETRAYTGGPWNSHVNISGDPDFHERDPSPEVLTSFTNIPVTTTSQEK